MLLPELTRIHDQFLSLSRIARERFVDALGGKLLLHGRLDASGVAVVVASSVAGGVSLYVDADADRLRESLRAGFVDFVVANLDEALRILKNEIRRTLPVSVGLAADPEPCIDAMIGRGLQPDLLSATPQRQALIFLERGALALPEHPTSDPATSLLEWTVADDVARSMPRMARMAGESLDPARNDTRARRRWLEQAPRYLGRAFGSRQCLRMVESEAAAFLSRVHSEIPAAKITRPGGKR
ncbi:MAG: hypothetical protein WB524_01220 [Acidobacteriaceae bacterium]